MHIPSTTEGKLPVSNSLESKDLPPGAYAPGVFIYRFGQPSDTGGVNRLKEPVKQRNERVLNTVSDRATRPAASRAIPCSHSDPVIHFDKPGRDGHQVLDLQQDGEIQLAVARVIVLLLDALNLFNNGIFNSCQEVPLLLQG